MNQQQLLYFAQRMIQSNQDKIPNAPWAKSAINAIMNGDANTGARIAENLCNSNGVTKEQALKSAAEFFTH